MNKERRKEISDIISELESLKVRIETVRDAEQDAFDNLPEGLQQGDGGQVMETAVSELDDAVNYCDDVSGSLETARGEG